MKKYLVTRDVEPSECNWLKETVKKNTILYKYQGPTYGCISWSGVAVTAEQDKTPFFEMPYDVLRELPIR